MPYQIGVTPANMQELTDLSLPDPLYQPLSDWMPFSGKRQRMDGLVVGTGRPAFTWRFNELSIAQMGTLLYYVTVGGVLQASNAVYVRTRIDQANMTDRVFQSYRAVMLTPIEPDDVRYEENRKFVDVEIKFISATTI